MPLNGIPPSTIIPYGSPYEFLKVALGDQPVELSESQYTWQQAPGIPPSVSLDIWQLDRIGDTEEKDLGQGKRFLRGLGFAESAEESPFGERASRR
jgi:hypothetical protein